MSARDLMGDLEAEASGLESVPSDGESARLRAACHELVVAERQVRRLEEELRRARAQYNELRHETLPSIMTEIGQDRMGLPDVGEHGADVVLTPYYHANIATDWEDDRRAAAFAHLEALGGGDLVRAQLSVPAGRGDLEKMRRIAQRVEQMLAQEGVSAAVRLDMTVPWNSLTAFVREYTERAHGEDDPVLVPERIGATIGSVVKIKLRKE